METIISIQHKICEILMILSLLFFMSCSTQENGGVSVVIDDVPSELSTVELALSSLYKVADNNIPILIRLSLLDDNGDALDGEYDVYINKENLGMINSFNPNEVGRYQVYVKANDKVSETLDVSVRAPISYTQKERLVIFHIVHDGEPIGEGTNIAKEMIDYQMSLLEATFGQSNVLTGNSHYTYIDFELATHDPLGNELNEPGINRLQRPSSQSTILFEDWMWNHYWDPNYYINVWVGETGNGFSWGIYPTIPCNGDLQLDGIDCSNNEIPNHGIEGIALNINNLYPENWVFPHEMGHYFGLFHVFELDICDFDVDYCGDTRQYGSLRYLNGATNNQRTSCKGFNYISYNIMDYWNQPNGSRDLTYDQTERIRYIIDHGKWRGQKQLGDGTPRDMSQLYSGRSFQDLKLVK